MKNFIRALFAAAAMSVTIIGCHKKSEDVAPAESTTKSTATTSPVPVTDSGPALQNTFVSSSHVADYSLQELQGMASALGLSSYSQNIIYGVATERIIYTTTISGKIIQASGLLYLPKADTGHFPLLSVQHGTTFLKSQAPSLTGKPTGGELAAATGFITVAPDYIGYGASATVFHPYYDYASSAAAVTDMLTAAQNYLASSTRLKLNKKLFLLGYSEGGYVTMAAQKAIEGNPLPNLRLTAVAAGAGGYDLKGMLQSMETADYYSYPSYLAFVIRSFDTTYAWHKPYSYFFKERYAKNLPWLLDGTHDGPEINDSLTTKPDSLFNATFYVNLKGAGELQFKQALAINSLTGWNPVTPLRMYHGTADEIIPYANSQNTFNSLQNAGAKNIQLIPVPGGTHESSFVPMLQGVFPWFESLK